MYDLCLGFTQLLFKQGAFVPHEHFESLWLTGSTRSCKKPPLFLTQRTRSKSLFTCPWRTIFFFQRFLRPFGWPSQSFPPGESSSSIQCQDCLSAITWHPAVHAGSLPLLQLIVLRGSELPCERSNEYTTDGAQDHDFYTLALKDNFSLWDVFPPVHFVNDNY